MPSSIFAQLNARMFAGLSLLGLLLAGVQTLRVHEARRETARVSAQLEAVAAERTMLRNAAAGYVEAGKARSRAAETALKAQAKQSAAIRLQIDRIRGAPPAADCKTPPEVLESDL